MDDEGTEEDEAPPLLSEPVEGAPEDAADQRDFAAGRDSMVPVAEVQVSEPVGADAVAVAPTSTVASHVAAQPAASSTDALSMSAVWAKVQGAEARRSLRTLIQKLSPVSLVPGLAIIEVPADCMEIAKTNQRELEQLIASVSGKRTAIEFREQGVTRPHTGDRSAVTNSAFAEPAAPAAAITDHPVVKRAAELFNARVISVQPRKRPAASVAAPVPGSSRASSVQESPASTESGPSGDGQEDQERDQDTGDSD